MTGAAGPDVYAVFAGPITQDVVTRFFFFCSNASRTPGTSLHVLMHSAGGSVPDGIALYNLFKSLPLPLTLYNAGIVSSIATVAFLGAKRRIAAESACFMVHRTLLGPLSITGSTVPNSVRQLSVLDSTTQALLKVHLELSEAQWEQHRVGELWLTAPEAVAARVCDEIGQFSPPPGTAIVYI